MKNLCVRANGHVYAFRLEDSIWPHYSYKVHTYSGNATIEVTRHIKKGVVEDAAFFTGTWSYTLEER